MMPRFHLGTDSSPLAQNDNLAVISESLTGIYPKKGKMDFRSRMSEMTPMG